MLSARGTVRARPIYIYCGLIHMTFLANLQAGSRHIEANPAHPSVLFSQANWYLFHSCPAPTWT